MINSAKLAWILSYVPIILVWILHVIVCCPVSNPPFLHAKHPDIDWFVIRLPPGDNIL